MELLERLLVNKLEVSEMKRVLSLTLTGLLLLVCMGCGKQDVLKGYENQPDVASQEIINSPSSQQTSNSAMNNDYGNSGGSGNMPAGSGGSPGSILVGVDGTYPTVYYQGILYSWIRLYYDPNRLPVPNQLPEKFEYIGDIIHIEDSIPTEDLQFTSWFDASGAAYRSEDSPDIIVVYLTTPWIEESTAIVFHSDSTEYYRQQEGLYADEWYALMDELFPYPK